jgi:hypothetical protein
MVRNMVGTAMECWLGRLLDEHIAVMLRMHRHDEDDDK